MKKEWKEFQVESIDVPEELGERILTKVKSELESKKLSGTEVSAAPESDSKLNCF